MSRNVDLLTETEHEREVGSNRDQGRASASRPAGQVFSPSGAVEPPAMLRLVRNIFVVNKADAPRQVVFVGVDEENGSSAVCANVGRALATLTDKPVCLVDGNIAAGRLSHQFKDEKPTPVSAKFGSFSERCVKIAENLWLAGTALISDPHGCLLPPDELKDVLAQLNSAFDYLLIDAPGTRTSSDAELLGQAADASVLVIEANKTRRADTVEAKDRLEMAGVRLLGTMLNNQTFPIPEKLYRHL